MRRIVILALLFALCGCDKDEEATPAEGPASEVEELVAQLPEKPTPIANRGPQNLQFFGRFGTNGAMPGLDGDSLVEVDEKAVAELNLVAQFRAQSAFVERDVDPDESLIMQFGGGEADGLRVTVRYQGKSVARNIAPANNGPELVSNMDHTLDRLLDELGIPRKLPVPKPR